MNNPNEGILLNFDLNGKNYAPLLSTSKFLPKEV